MSPPVEEASVADRLDASIHSWAAPLSELVTGPSHRPLDAAPRVEANARLTATIGIVLLLLFAAEGITVLSIHRLLPLHDAIGLLLIPPVLLKMASTGRRFAAYYLGDREYRAAGPPPILLRLAGPLVVILTAALLGTGVELWLFGPRFGSLWLTAHKASFVLWLGVMAIHVLGHLERAPRLALRDLAGRPAVAGSGRRRAWLAASLLMGLALAAAVLLYHSPFMAPLEH